MGGNFTLDKSYIYQVLIREWIENDWDKGIFVPVYGGRKDDKWDIFFQSYLVPADRTEEQLKTDTYDAYGLLRPGVTVYGAWDSGEAAYYKWGNNASIEPLVIKRDYNDLARDNIEIVEEFRFLFNLYYNSQSKEYVDLENDTSVVKISDDNLVGIQRGISKAILQ